MDCCSSAGAPYEPALGGITSIQHSIAKLLVEGHVTRRSRAVSA